MKKKDLQQLYTMARKAIGVSWLVIFGVVETVDSAPPSLERPASVAFETFADWCLNVECVILQNEL